MAGYNCPDNVSASDPDAPWNQEEPDSYQDWCEFCGNDVGFEEIDGHRVCQDCLKEIIGPTP